MNRRRAMAWALSCVLWSGVAAAEPPAVVVEPGTRVRVSTTAGIRIVGKMLAHDADALTLETKRGRPPLIVPAKSVRGLEVSHGRGSLSRRVGVGIFIGAAAGYGLSVLNGGEDRCEPEEICLDGLVDLEGIERVFATVAGGVAGGLVGGLAGREKWQPAQRRLALTIRPTVAASGGRRGRIDGVAASVHFAF